MDAWEMVGTTPFMVTVLLLSAVTLALVARGRGRGWQAATWVGWFVASGVLGWALAAPATDGEGGACPDSTFETVRGDAPAGCVDAARGRYAVGTGTYVALAAGGVALLASRRRRDSAGDSAGGYAGARGSGISASRVHGWNQ